MDPNLFHLDWERTFEVLSAVVILSFIVERGLALIFEHRLYVEKAAGKGLKEAVSFLLSLGICVYWEFDALSMIILAEQTSFPGYIVTAGVIAGGSKASVKLFRDILGFQSTAYQQAKAAGSKSSNRSRSSSTSGG